MCQQLEKKLKVVQSTINYILSVDVFNDGQELIKYLNDGNRFDIIYLDIEMKNIGGIEVRKTIRETLKDEHTKIVFVSAHKSYSFDLHKVRAMDFLIKPISQENITESINTAISLLKKPNKYFTYVKENKQEKIPVNNIICFESCGRQVKIVAAYGNDYFYGKLSDLIVKLDNDMFYAVHKSYIINYNRIKESTYEELLMSNGDKIPISQSHRKEVRKKLLDKRFKG